MKRICLWLFLIVSVNMAAAQIVIQHWNKKETALKGVAQGAKVILSPASRTYLDMKYNVSDLFD